MYYDITDPTPTISPPIEVTPNASATTFSLIAPYSSNVPRRFRNEWNGQWTKPRWIFPMAVKDKVFEYLHTTFGWTPEQDQTLIPIEIQTTTRRTEVQGPIILAGIQLAIAQDRDHGARTGPGVSLIEGAITSSGSRHYWESIAEAGSIWRCHATCGQIEVLLRTPDTSVRIYPYITNPEGLSPEQIQRLTTKIVELTSHIPSDIMDRLLDAVETE